MPSEWNQDPKDTDDQHSDLERIKSIVGQRFPFYDMKYNRQTIAFFCRIDSDSLEDKFTDLRLALSEKGYIPMLRYVNGEHIIYVIKKAHKKERPIWVNISLLLATIITTTLTGALLSMGVNDLWSLSRFADVFQAEHLLNGSILFAFPLMSILFIHEMGHYYISKKHGLATSLPFFIPIPPIVPTFNIGTFGALISSRDPMPDKKTLFDVGIAGPLAGFAVAIPVTIVGIMTSTPAEIVEQTTGEIILGGSLLFSWLAQLFSDIPAGVPIDLSLIAFAGWIGLLITSINLLPAGQLDGGHIFRAFLGDKQRWAGWIAVVIMIFTGWFFFAILIMFMIGLQHPPPLNDASPLDRNRKLLFFVAVFILVVCYIPYPIYVA